MNKGQSFHTIAVLVQDEVANVISAVDPEEITSFISSLLNADRIFIAGNGRTGLQMKAFAMRLMHLGLVVHVVGEVTAPGLTPQDLLVIGSSSGKSDTLAAFSRKAQAMGTPIAALTASPESLIAKAAGIHVYLPAPSYKRDASGEAHRILPMGGLFENALGIVLDVVVLMLMEKREITEKEMIIRHTNLE